MTVEFAGEKPNTIVIEFLKYIVGITYDDTLDIDIYVDCKNYLIDFGVDDKILVPINDRTGLIINLLNLRPSTLILHNYSAFPKDVYSLLKYVFGAKFRVEVWSKLLTYIKRKSKLIIVLKWVWLKDK